MKANISNIQKTYSEIPGTWEFEGVTYQGYEHFTDLHFAQGWRDVVIPTITETQKLSNDFILVDDIVTKEVVELSEEEIAEANKSKVPIQVKNMKFRLALIKSGIMPSSIDTAINQMPEGAMKENTFTLWNFADYLERIDASLNYMAGQFNISQEQLDNLFILSDTI